MPYRPCATSKRYRSSIAWSRARARQPEPWVATSQWDEVYAATAFPTACRLILSNTTEAGYSVDAADRTAAYQG